MRVGTFFILAASESGKNSMQVLDPHQEKTVYLPQVMSECPYCKMCSSTGPVADLSKNDAACGNDDCKECKDGQCVSLEVNLSISSPPDNPSPSDSAWATNYSFLSTSNISGSAMVDKAGKASLIEWDITSTVGTVKNINPSNKKGAQIGFQPDVTHPPYGTAGSPARSSSLSYTLSADICTKNETVTITQDQRDIIRQEYVNHGITVPNRSDLNTPVATVNFSVAEINVTAYSLIWGQPGPLAQSVRDQYNVLIANELGLSNPTNYGLILNSTWRNPERNEFVEGKKDSLHQFGNAVDISILASTEMATGISDDRLYCILEAAGDAVGLGIPENQSIQVACNDPEITHVHVQ